MRFAKWRTSRLSPDPSMSDAFDFDLAFDVDREGHGLSRAAKSEPLQHRGRAALQRRVMPHNPSGPQPKAFARVARTPPSVASVHVVILRKRSRARSGRLPTKDLCNPACSGPTDVIRLRA
jgi:hypothetical protein